MHQDQRASGDVGYVFHPNRLRMIQGSQGSMLLVVGGRMALFISLEGGDHWFQKMSPLLSWPVNRSGTAGLGPPFRDSKEAL